MNICFETGNNNAFSTIRNMIFLELHYSNIIEYNLEWKCHSFYEDNAQYAGTNLVKLVNV